MNIGLNYSYLTPLYVDITWDNNKDLRDLFGNDESQFKASFIDRLKAIYKNCVGYKPNEISLEAATSQETTKPIYNTSYFNNFFKSDSNSNTNIEPTSVIEDLSEDSFFKIELK